MRIWRISNHANLSGTGGKFSEGRWNYLGTEIVYCSDHPSTCLLELLVRFDPDTTPENYHLLEILVPEDVGAEQPELKSDWRDDLQYTRNLWEAFCSNRRHPVMQVPSAIMPQANHFLLNPQHPDHFKIGITASYDNLLDERFYG
ncbi:MAG: RES family NAD+ phosphorylase [Pseudomonadota bacterium]